MWIDYATQPGLIVDVPQALLCEFSLRTDKAAQLMQAPVWDAATLLDLAQVYQQQWQIDYGRIASL